MHHFDFLGKAKYFVPISILLVVLSWILVIPGVRGLNPGIDFSGGTEFTVKFSEPVTTAEVRSALAEIPAPIDLSKSVIQNVAGKNTMVITTQLDVEANQSTIKAIEDTLRSKFKVEDVSRYSIGKQVSRELMQKGWQAVLLALVVILVYVSWRFRLRYAVGAVVALIHDVSIALGVFALFHIEVNLATIAAFLTIVGYSLNDTIVIFDRIRENLKIDRKASIFDIINKSVNQSLSRTLNTSLTTFIPVFIMFLFGGSVLRGFALALLIGVIVGTYSSMYIANPIVYAWTLKAGVKRSK
ncbi:protein translocase subunit SecF [bacterium]|nr:protein translocase subunit SecF [Candidatus Bipolaricaulota bacterium]RKZ27927.1 MAG: protein translocase subunit SecF [bacterium]